MDGMIPEDQATPQMVGDGQQQETPAQPETSAQAQQPQWTEDQIRAAVMQAREMGAKEAILAAKEKGYWKDPVEEAPAQPVGSKDPLVEELEMINAIAKERKDPHMTTIWFQKKIKEGVEKGVLDKIASEFKPYFEAMNDEIGNRKADAFLDDHPELKKLKPTVRKFVEKHGIPVEDLIEMKKTLIKEAEEKIKKEYEREQSLTRARATGYLEGSDVEGFNVEAHKAHEKTVAEMDAAIRSGDTAALNKVFLTHLRRGGRA